MSRNVEIKASLNTVTGSFDNVRMIAERLATCKAELLNQTDTFYHSKQGRLKLRENPERTYAQLIFYKRSDTEGPKQSTFYITKIASDEVEAFKLSMKECVGEKCLVKKERVLIMIGQTRVHLDRVQGLGEFMELEVMLRDEQTEAEGTAIAEQLRLDLGVEKDWLISGAYADMLMKNAGDN